jgi:hypothetical protein
VYTFRGKLIAQFHDLEPGNRRIALADKVFTLKTRDFLAIVANGLFSAENVFFQAGDLFEQRGNRAGGARGLAQGREDSISHLNPELHFVVHRFPFTNC